MTERKLDFLAVGPQRTASTWLDQCLRANADLRLPRDTKETFYWDRHHELSDDWYWAHFDTACDDKYCGEVGSTYFHASGLPERIAMHNPNCLIILTIRDPSERAVSLMRHLKRVGKLQTQTFKEALEQCPELFRSDFYQFNLEKWLNVFPVESLLLILTDDIKHDPIRVVENVTSHLGVKRHLFAKAEAQINAGAEARIQFLNNMLYKLARTMRRWRLNRLVEVVKKIGGRRIVAKNVPLDENQRELAMLSSYYEADISFIESFTSRNLSAWRHK